MTRLLRCNRCGNDIATFMRVGEHGTCKVCGVEFTVPLDSQEVGITEIRDLPPPVRPEPPTVRGEVVTPAPRRSSGNSRKYLGLVVIMFVAIALGKFLAKALGNAVGVSYDGDQPFDLKGYAIHNVTPFVVFLAILSLWWIIGYARGRNRERTEPSAPINPLDQERELGPTLALAAAGVVLLWHGLLASIQVVSGIPRGMTGNRVDAASGALLGWIGAVFLLGSYRKKERAWSNGRALWVSGFVAGLILMSWLAERLPGPEPARTDSGPSFADVYLLVAGGAWFLSHALFRLDLRRRAVGAQAHEDAAAALPG